MAFDLTLARGGFGSPLDTTLMQYRIFYQMYYDLENNRANLATANNWLNDMRTYWGPQIETYAAFSQMGQHARKRLLQFARCQVALQVWSFMALGPRPPETFLFDNNRANFDRHPDRFVDALIMRTEFDHMTTRGDSPVLAAIALTALGLPSTPEALYKDHDDATARAVLSFCRIFGSAFESIVNIDDNELDYQDVATGARFSAASRHDRTFMDYMEFHSWIAEAVYWSVSGSDLFNAITQMDVGSDALDATQAEALELFSLLRGVGQTGGKQRHMDMPKALFYAELAAYGFVPSFQVLLFGLTENLALRDGDGNVFPGRIYIRAQAPVVGSHPQPNTWVENGDGSGGAAQTFELVVEVPAGQTPDHIEAVVDVLQPVAGTRWFNFSGPVALDADTFTLTPVVDVAGKTRWTIDATKAAKWAAGEVVIGEFVLAHGPHVKTSPANGIPVENVSLLVEDTAVDESALYNVVPSRVLTGLEMPPTRTPLFAQRASGTLDNA